MTGIEVIPFSFEGKDYQVRVVYDGATIYVRAFCGHRPANGYSYQVNIMKALDLKKLIGLDAIKEFIKSAQDDVKEKRWERLLEAVEVVNKART